MGGVVFTPYLHWFFIRESIIVEGIEIVQWAAFIGIGATVILDLWAAALSRFFSIPATNWAMVGRWVSHMPEGRFVHENIGNASPVSGELAIGWIIHYVIGAGYGVLLVAIWGVEWIQQPELFPPVVLALALLAAPYFILMPGMGLGIAGAKTSNPNLTRLKSFVGHSIFGLGMYVTALLIHVNIT